MTIARGSGRSFLLNHLGEFFVGQEGDITDTRCWRSPDIIHPDMFRQHIKRADLRVQPDLDRAVG